MPHQFVSGATVHGAPHPQNGISRYRRQATPIVRPGNAVHPQRMPQHRDAPVVGHIPYPRGAVLRRRCQTQRIGGETDREHPPGMAPQFHHQFLRLNIPETNHTVAAGGGDPVSLSWKSDAVDVSIAVCRTPLRREDGDPRECVRIPEADGAIGRRRGNQSSIGSVGAPIHRSRVAT